MKISENNLIQIEPELWKRKRKSSDRYDLIVKSICHHCDEGHFQYKNRITQFCSRTCQSLSANNYYLTDKSVEVMNGLLLSDGCLQYRNDSLNACFSQTCKYKEYLDYLKEQLSFPSKIASYNYIDKRWNKRIYSNQLTTKQSELFSSLYREWYPTGEKQVPNNLKLTPITLLHWFLGDGYGGDHSINLCTDSFSESHINYLITELDNLNIKSNIQQHGKHPRIYIPTKYQMEFLGLIGRCPVKCYEYKWDHKITESYFNRKCKFCNSVFDANSRNKIYCSNKCIQKSYENRSRHGA